MTYVCLRGLLFLWPVLSDDPILDNCHNTICQTLCLLCHKIVFLGLGLSLYTTICFISSSYFKCLSVHSPFFRHLYGDSMKDGVKNSFCTHYNGEQTQTAAWEMFMPRLVRFGLDRKRCLAAPGLTLCLSPQQRLPGTKQICQPYSLGGSRLRTSLRSGCNRVLCH